MRIKWTIWVAAVCALPITKAARQAEASRRAKALSAGVPYVRRATRYYELQGQTLWDLAAEFRRLAGTGNVPERYGRTTWNVRLDPDPHFGTRTSCATQPVTLRVTLTQILPKASRSADFSPDDAAEWRRFLPLLMRHEMQHDSIVVANATTFFRAVERDGDRGAPVTSIDYCVAELLDRIGRANAALDSTTNHGATDGAVLRAVRGTAPDGSQSGAPW
jgi:predicted secreted Zn-dependent protease